MIRPTEEGETQIPSFRKVENFSFRDRGGLFLHLQIEIPLFSLEVLELYSIFGTL